MFCHKCGAQVVEGAAFCPKCGTKIVHTDDAQQSMSTSTPVVEPQQTSAETPPIAENNQSTLKSNTSLRKVAIIGRVLMWGALLLLFLHLPISPAILVAGVAIGIILSALGAKRPLGLSKIIELVVAAILLVVVGFSTLLSGGTGDKYVQMVKGGILDGYPQMTVGEAFDGFLSDPKWESGLSDDNVRFVNVTGGALYFGEEAELAVQFIIVDEKDGSFQYNACEVNGTPQSDLVFWGLLETIYSDSASGGDSPSKGLDSQGDLDFLSDPIMIDETQSYDNEYGNIEVTLNYAAFTDKLENTLLGGYIYPDEGNVFLWADVTVNNIGTEKGSLLTAWNTLVFDGAYEFEHHTTVGDVVDINPLTAPTDGGLVFMVPTSVMESDKSLVLNINDGGGNVVLSYVIRPGDGTGSIAGPNDADTDNNVLAPAGGTYGFSSICSLLGTSVEDIMNDWGTPLEYEAGGGVNYCAYDGITFNFDADGVVTNIDLEPSKCVINAETLDKNREGLLVVLGTPTEEGWEPAEYTDMYRMRYENFRDGVGVVVELVTPDDMASSMRIWQD